MKPVPSKRPAAVRGGVFVSDLHLFSPRSAAGDVHHQLSTFRSKEQCIVLGGDIFDFRWSDRGSHRATLHAALVWLEKLLLDTGQSQIEFLPGNHDCHPDFLQQLARLAEREPRFAWNEHHLQIGNSLFLHGDILDARGGLPAYRAKFHHVQPQSPLSQRAYDAAVSMRVHKLVPRLRHPPRATCQRLSRFIGTLPLEQKSSVRRVFFGHTHVPIHGLEMNEVRFFNPGAALRHMQPVLQHFAFDSLTDVG